MTQGQTFEAQTLAASKAAKLKQVSLGAKSLKEIDCKRHLHGGSPSLVKVILTILMFVSGAFNTVQAAAEVPDAEISQNGLAPIYEISNPSLAHFAAAVGYIFSISDLRKYFTILPSEANFIFISKPRAIVFGKITLENLAMFDGAAKEQIGKFIADADECFVQPIFLDNTQRIILVINSSDNGPEDIDKKCFLLGLAFFDNYAVEEIEELNSLNVNEMTLKIINRTAAVHK